MNKIMWLASYPKSGNTWCRTLISNLTNPDSNDIQINQLKTDGISSSRGAFDQQTLIKSTDLTYAEIDALRPEVYNYQSSQATETLWVKVHDAYTYIQDESKPTPLFPKLASRGVVYILRNPLDVAVSYAAHNNSTIDQAIISMNNPSHCMSAKLSGVHSQFRQQLLSWSQHVLSWTNQTEIPLLVVRYEDLQTTAIATVTKLAQFCGLNTEQSAIEQTLDKSDFKRLQQQEQEHGFKEKPQFMQAFFRQGKSGDWRQKLSEQQISTIIEHHGETMRKFGYLAENGKILNCLNRP